MDLNSVPEFAPGCRLHPIQDVLLMPEGALKLNGPSRDVLVRLNGRSSVAAIVANLLQGYLGTNVNKVRTDVIELLEQLEHRGVVQIRR
jgi:pyrroloquinoline quinone biosynthesis protein D